MAEIVPLADAVRELVHDGDTVALEGFTHLIPFAAGHEIVRQRYRDLTLIRMTPDLIYDQLIGMGCARKLVFSWGGNPGVGSLHRFRDAVEHDWPAPLELEALRRLREGVMASVRSGGWTASGSGASPRSGSTTTTSSSRGRRRAGAGARGRSGGRAVRRERRRS